MKLKKKIRMRHLNRGKVKYILGNKRDAKEDSEKALVFAKQYLNFDLESQIIPN